METPAQPHRPSSLQCSGSRSGEGGGGPRAASPTHSGSGGLLPSLRAVPSEPLEQETRLSPLPSNAHQPFRFKSWGSFIIPFITERISFLHPHPYPSPASDCFPLSSGNFFFNVQGSPSLSIYPATWGLSGAGPLPQLPNPNSSREES